MTETQSYVNIKPCTNLLIDKRMYFFVHLQEPPC